MSLDTYTNLQAEVTDLLNRGDLAAKVPTWIALVEARLQRILEGRNMRSTVGVAFTTSGTIALPSDFRSPVALTLETQLRTWDVTLVPYALMTQKRGELTAGPPLYATVLNGNLLIAPLADSDTDYTGTLVYDANVAPLSATNPSNWVLVNHPDVYLYGAALHSAPYLKDDERLQMWKDLHDTAIEEVRLATDRAEFGTAPLRIVPPRIPGEG